MTSLTSTRPALSPDRTRLPFMLTTNPAPQTPDFVRSIFTLDISIYQVLFVHCLYSLIYGFTIRFVDFGDFGVGQWRCRDRSKFLKGAAICYTKAENTITAPFRQVSNSTPSSGILWYHMVRYRLDVGARHFWLARYACQKKTAGTYRFFQCFYVLACFACVACFSCV